MSKKRTCTQCLGDNEDDEVKRFKVVGPSTTSTTAPAPTVPISNHDSAPTFASQSACSSAVSGDQEYHFVWQCGHCGSIHAEAPAEAAVWKKWEGGWSMTGTPARQRHSAAMRSAQSSIRRLFLSAPIVVEEPVSSQASEQ